MAKEYKMIFTWEKEVPAEALGAYTPFQYYCDFPEDGEYEGEAEFDTVSEYNKIREEWEGHLYQLFKGDKEIDSGCFDPISPVENIALAGVKCCSNCEECFWHEAAMDSGSDFWEQYKPDGCKFIRIEEVR